MKRLDHLIALFETNKALLRANPEYYFNAACNELKDARKCIDDILYSLSSDSIFDFIDKQTTLTNPSELSGDDRLKVDKAKEVIENYLKSKGS